MTTIRLAIVALLSCLLLSGCVGKADRKDAGDVGSVIATPDAFERRTAASGAHIVRGRTATSEWRLYGWTDKKKACVGFYEVATDPAAQELSSGGSWCDHKLPLGVSVVRSEHGDFVFGVVDAAAATIRIEYVDAGTDSLIITRHPEFPHAFYAGELRAGKAARILLAVAEDGRVLGSEAPPAQRTN